MSLLYSLLILFGSLWLVLAALWWALQRPGSGQPTPAAARRQQLKRPDATSRSSPAQCKPGPLRPCCF
ncbi:MAG: hypothetical protein EST26_02555 [Hydrogenophaga sp.]|nr:hypothetical protein [Hydrogenophaga sp.]